MICPDISELKRVISYLLQILSVQVGFVEWIDSENTEDYYQANGIRVDKSVNIWESLRNHPDYKEAVGSNSDYVFRIEQAFPCAGLYSQGFRYGLVIPFYSFKVHRGSVLLCGPLPFPSEERERICKLCKQIAKFLMKVHLDTTFVTHAVGRLNLPAPRSLANELSYALSRKELTLEYQQQVDLRSGRVQGLEALLRWHHPLYGVVPPSEFIPIAEKSGLICPIGEWVLRKACAQNKEWQVAGITPMTVSVNLSPGQFVQNQLTELVKGILSETGLSPHYLDIEITESMTMEINSVLATLSQLKSIGVQISLDDFGSGYSSLYYLKRLPIDKLKIDQSFICDCHTDENDAILVKTIISMAHQLKLKVIAEGVETREQLIFLQQNLCDEVQGYLFSKSLTAEQLTQYLPAIGEKSKKFGLDTGRRSS